MTTYSLDDQVDSIFDITYRDLIYILWGGGFQRVSMFVFERKEEEKNDMKTP